MKTVAIAGAGITGLTAAFRLAEHGIPCTLYEASGRVGGVIHTTREDGYLAEAGPNIITDLSPVIGALVRDAGLGPRRVDANPAAKNNFLLHRGRLCHAPDSLFKFIGSPLFSPRGKLRVCMEPFVRPSPSARDETLARFVSRRLGSEFLEAVINPFVAGVYAGDPSLLSVRHGFPKLFAAEQIYGSLFRAQIFGAGARRRAGEVPKSQVRKFSFDHGLEVLPARLAARLDGSIEFNARLAAIQPSGGGWNVQLAGPDGQPGPTRSHSALLLAMPAHRLSGIVLIAPGVPANALSTLGEIIHPPVASVVLGFKRPDVRHPLDGFGCLVSATEKRRILGAIFSSSIFPGRAPAGHVAITAFIGGCRNPDLALKSPERLIAIALADLRDILGVIGSPTFEHCTVIPHAIPQYNVGYARFRQTMELLEIAHPGLFFAGTCKDGISLGNSIVSGNDAGRRIRSFLTRIHQFAETAA